MKYRIRNWSEHQHYKDRNPPWIKLHFSLLSSRDWVTLDDASRVLAVASMLIASRSEPPGEFEGDAEYFKRVAYLNSAPDFNPLILCGFIEPLADASKVQADARPETETETETEREAEKRESGAIAPAHTVSKSCFVPDDWFPEQILPGQVRIADGVDIEYELTQFRLHEFAQPKSNWQNAWLQWLGRAKPRAAKHTDAKIDNTLSAARSFLNG